MSNHSSNQEQQPTKRPGDLFETDKLNPLLKRFKSLNKSKKFAKQNRDYLDLLDVVSKARHGFEAEQARLKSKPAQDAAKQLVRQLDLIYNLVLMPYALLMLEEGKIDVLRNALKALSGKKRKLEDGRKAFERESKRSMKLFFALDHSGGISRSWLFSITSYIWTAFECLASDLWVNSVNYSTTLAQQTLKSIPNDDEDQSGLSRKHIEVGLAARYGFDLRRCLGTVLKSKFDFSSVDGVQAAFKQAFGTSGKLDQYSLLKQLEQVRHLIVHRGGITDEKFLRITKLKARRAAPLSLTLNQVGEYMVSATLGCLALLQVEDEWFTANS